MSQFYFLALLFFASASAFETRISEASPDESQIQPRGVVIPPQNCSAVGTFTRLEITGCTKFPCEILTSTLIELYFTPSRGGRVQPKLTLTPTCGPAPAPIPGTISNIGTGPYVLRIPGFAGVTTVTDGAYTLKLELLTLDNPIQTQACISGAVNWKVKGGSTYKCGSAATSASILGVITMALMAVWKTL